jgi:hypothetical protein
MDKNSLIAIFIFYAKATGVQAWMAFNDEFRHCNIIVFDGSDWLMIDFDRTGLRVRKIKCRDGNQLIRLLPVNPDVTATVSVMVKDRAKVRWKPFWVRSCNEVCRYASGVDIGFTFNPIGLYQKLLRYRGRRNYELLSAWRRKKDGLIRRRRKVRFRKDDGRAVSIQSSGIGIKKTESIQDST